MPGAVLLASLPLNPARSQFSEAVDDRRVVPGPVPGCCREWAGSADGRHGQWQAGHMSGSPAAPVAEAPAPAASEGPEAARWIDVFPWIDDVCQGTVTGPRAAERAAQLVKWRAERPAEGPEQARLERVAVLGDIAIELMPDWPLGRLVPGLPGTASLDHMGMNTRARNVLFRASYKTVADLALVTIGQLAELRTVGRDTVAAAVRALIGAAALAPPAAVLASPAAVMLPPAWEDGVISGPAGAVCLVRQAGPAGPAAAGRPGPGRQPARDPGRVAAPDVPHPCACRARRGPYRDRNPLHPPG